MADVFDVHRAQAKATIEKFIATKPNAVETTASFATKIDPATGSTFAAQAGLLARAFADLEKVPKTFNVKDEDMPNVRALIAKIEQFGTDTDALTQLYNHWSLNIRTSTIQQNMEDMSQLITNLHESYDFLKNEAFGHEDILKVPLPKLLLFGQKRMLLYTVTKNIYRQEITDSLLHPQNQNVDISHLIQELEVYRQVCMQFVNLKESVSQVLQVEPTIPPKSNLMVLQRQISLNIDACVRALTMVNGAIEHLKEIRRQQAEQANIQPRNVTPQPSAITQETTRTARDIDQEMERIATVFNSFKEGILRQQTSLTSRFSQITPEIDDIHNKVRSLSKTSTPDEFATLEQRVALMRARVGEIAREATSLDQAIGAFGRGLANEESTLIRAHDKLKIIIDAQQSQLDDELKRDFENMLKKIHDIIVCDDDIKGILVSLQNSLDNLETLIRSRRIVESQQAAQRASEQVQQASARAASSAEPVRVAAATSERVGTTARARRGRAAASIVRREKLEEIAREYNSTRLLLIPNMKLILTHSTFNFENFAGDKVKLQAHIVEIDRLPEVQLRENMRDLSRHIRDGIEKTEAKVAIFMNEIPPQIFRLVPNFLAEINRLLAILVADKRKLDDMRF